MYIINKIKRKIEWSKSKEDE